MKKTIIYTALFLIPLLSYSQNKAKAPEAADTAKVNGLINEAKTYFTSDAPKALSLSYEARNLAKKVGFSTGEAYAYKNIGITYYFQNKYLEALDNYNQSLHIFQEIKDNVGIANLQNNIEALCLLWLLL